jgi:integrase
MDLAQRIRRRIVMSGEHELWQGSTDNHGTGQIRIDGRLTTVRKVLWEMSKGAVPDGIRVKACPFDPACVTVAHLSLENRRGPAPPTKARARKGTGSMRKLRPGHWELRVTVGRWSDGQPRTLYRTVEASGESDATAQLAAFVNEMLSTQQPSDRSVRDLTVDDAIDLFLTEYLADEKGREQKTISDYRALHQKWFAPVIGAQRVNRIDTATLDRVFGAMRKAGLSASRLNQAKSLYRPFFRWAKRRGMTTRDPMLDFELPTSTYLSAERTPPEIEQLTLLLTKAIEVVPDIAPLLTLGAVTGMRRGELVGIRRSRVLWTELRITVDTAVTASRRVKGPKTRRQRSFHVDADTMAMLKNVCEAMDERAVLAGVDIAQDPYVFSLDPDCSRPIPPDYFTKQVAVLKGHLGIEDKRPETVKLEEEALRLRRQPQSARPVGKTGPAPHGGLSFREIGEQLGRSERWAAMAVQAAERRENAKASGLGAVHFDGSIVALRKFTSSELLDAGFNISMVAQRQGHGTQVLARHYSKARASSDRKAAEHLGRVVHSERSH